MRSLLSSFPRSRLSFLAAPVALLTLPWCSDMSRIRQSRPDAYTIESATAPRKLTIMA
jgi:hypothetical protein